MAVRNCLAVLETRISTGRLFQTEGAAWFDECFAVSVLIADLEGSSRDDDHRCRVGMSLLTAVSR